jgi:hypothetical protein
MLSYRKAKFMASALAINKMEFKPSYHFFTWMKELGVLSGRDVDDFWQKQARFGSSSTRYRQICRR